ncbi:MAG: quinone-dependent dihydroorotate dehydrogenase [Pseudomonadales bacterium]|nr:quinone-dependent dihydroorotate dehydrogenase [Pseudomonadales bacterium]
MYSLLQKALFQLPAETSHQFALKSLDITHRLGLSGLLAATVPATPIELLGMQFANPVGLAAGLDKNGDHIDSLAALGFGYIEIGTITPRAQPGNPKPRLFRIPEKQVIVNRMGFNNKGVDYLIERVKESRYQGVLGINIGKNVDTPVENATDDYLICMRKVYRYASYITVNLSSPNTPGLRSLQHGETLKSLLDALKNEQSKLALEHGKTVPLMIKIAPDLDSSEVESITKVLVEYEIEAVIATNTTLSRDAVRGCKYADEAGGLSGAPLLDASTEVVRTIRSTAGDKLKIIGVGGICDAKGAAEKCRAGADLLQIYSGFIYRGPELIREAAEGFYSESS